MRKVLPLIASMVLIAIASLFAGVGAMAYFSDIEVGEGNRFEAGTLDLKVDGGDVVQVITIQNMKPGDDTGYYKWVLRNVGSLPGNLTVTIEIIEDSDGIDTEPEAIAESEPYGYQGARPTLGHPDRGELSEFLKPTCGWGPPGWSVPSRIISEWRVGPSPAYAGWSFGLRSWDGKTFVYGTLGPGEEIAFFFKVRLESDLRAWDGCSWHDVDDNVIQGDYVTIRIIFRLVQE